MVDLATALTIGVVATFVPLVVGLLLPKALSRFQSPHATLWLVAFSSGVIFWFFLDVMGDAAQLGINQGFGGSYTHLALALAFVLGIAVLFGFERRFSRMRNVPPTGENPQMRSINSDITFVIAMIVALGIGFHALGEGMVIGHTLPSAVDIYDAIGGPYPGVAYVLHKLLEGFVVGTFAVIAAATRLRHIGVLAGLAGIPTVIGFFVGLPPATYESTYMFALGGAGAVYVELKLIPVLGRSGRFYSVIVPVLLGFYAMYAAGLFHSVAGG